MDTKILMFAVTIYLGIAGLLLTFLPQEIAIFFEAGTNPSFVLALQVLGSLYLGFGMMNWMAKNSIIGGIYNRPLVFGNFLHFLVSTFALLKMVQNYSKNQFVVILILSILYVIFAISFGYLLRTSPGTK